MISFLIGLYAKIMKKKEISNREMKQYIDSFSEPKDDYDRVYDNQQCAICGSSRCAMVLLNGIGLLAIPAFVFLYSLNRFLLRKEKKQKALLVCATNRTGKSYDYSGRIPQALYKEFGQIKMLKLQSFPRFTEGVLDFKCFFCWFGLVIRHPLSGFMNFRALLNLAGYNKLMIQYSPKAIINARQELNGFSSLITRLMESKKCEYINLMHGELMTDPNVAFVRFSRFYIWDAHYKNVLGWARVPSEQFIVFMPDLYKKRLERKENPDFDIAYILTGDEKTGVDPNLKKLKKILTALQENGCHCKVRPHPRWSNYQIVCKTFEGTGVQVDNALEVTTEETLKNTKYVAGHFSTVMTEAYYQGIPVILDDVTDRAVFQKMQDKMYFLLNKDHLLLSEMLEQFSKGEKKNAE